MSIEQALQERSGSKCELCGTDSDLSTYEVPPVTETSADKSILACDTCTTQINNLDQMDANHWRCLNDSMWNTEPAVQVMAWRLLTRLSSESSDVWPQDLLDMLYLEDDVKTWAEAGLETNAESDETPTKDSNGTTLIAGDTVTLIKDLVVKGAGFTAKRGTVVKNISLTDNPKHIEGRVNGTRIVLVSAYLKKST